MLLAEFNFNFTTFFALSRAGQEKGNQKLILFIPRRNRMKVKELFV